MYATACHIRLSGTDCSRDSKPTCSLLTPFCTCALLPLAHFLHRTCGARLIGASCCSALAPLCICLHVLPASKRRHNGTQTLPPCSLLRLETPSARIPCLYSSCVNPGFPLVACILRVLMSSCGGTSPCSASFA